MIIIYLIIIKIKCLPFLSENDIVFCIILDEIFGEIVFNSKDNNNRCFFHFHVNFYD